MICHTMLYSHNHILYELVLWGHDSEIKKSLLQTKTVRLLYSAGITDRSRALFSRLLCILTIVYNSKMVIDFPAEIKWCYMWFCYLICIFVSMGPIKQKITKNMCPISKSEHVLIFLHACMSFTLYTIITGIKQTKSVLFSLTSDMSRDQDYQLHTNFNISSFHYLNFVLKSVLKKIIM